MIEQSCPGKSSFSQMLGPAITGEPASTANDFAAASLYKSLHWLGDHACEKTASLHAEIWSPVDHATLCDSAWDGSPQGKELPARRRVDRQHEIFARSYRDQP
jgi:hypothetical protein